MNGRPRTSIEIADAMAELAYQRMLALRKAKEAHLLAWRARYAPAVKSSPERKCGAMTRLGRPCLRTALTNGRCLNHGGLSTGPKTKRGKQRIARAQRLRWKLWRQANAPRR